MVVWLVSVVGVELFESETGDDDNLVTFESEFTCIVGNQYLLIGNFVVCTYLKAQLLLLRYIN